MRGIRHRSTHLLGIQRLEMQEGMEITGEKLET
jgi:hypothetical protein